MTAKKQATVKKCPPEKLKGNNFYGMTLDEEQKRFMDAIYDKEKLIVFCNARAGTGKTTIAIMTAKMMVDYGLYDGIVYITAPVQEKKLGYMPGDVQQKTELYHLSFYQVADKIGINMNTCDASDIMNQKSGTGYVELTTHVFTRGITFENKIVIIEEAQNYYLDELKKVLTRISDSCKTVVIGHTGQIDLFHNPENSGFGKYIKWFETEDYCQVCNLTKNYRGLVSNRADDIV